MDDGIEFFEKKYGIKLPGTKPKEEYDDPEFARTKLDSGYQFGLGDAVWVYDYESTRDDVAHAHVLGFYKKGMLPGSDRKSMEQLARSAATRWSDLSAEQHKEAAKLPGPWFDGKACGRAVRAIGAELMEGKQSDFGKNKPRPATTQPEPHLTGVGLAHWGDSFPSTHWSIMLDPPSRDTASQRILERLCTRYWYPLYAYLRKRGHSSHDAQDLTQGFFSKMLEGDGLSGADRNRGRFRSYMIGALNHYLSDVRRKGAAEKRGGGRAPLSIDEELAEHRFRNEPADNLTPEKLFDREWAVALLQDVVGRLQQEYRAQGKAKVFDALSEFLTVKPEKGTYPVLAKQLGMTEGNVRVMVSRIRKRYKAVLLETIDQTVNDPEDAEDELQHLLAAFSLA